jgi:hypothetical protein
MGSVGLQDSAEGGSRSSTVAWGGGVSGGRWMGEEGMAYPSIAVC